MSIRNQNWYNSHASQRYPLDDNATGTGDDGTRLKDDIIADLHLRWPRLAGQYAYIGGITITDTLVTVIILAADSPSAASTPTPLAAVTLAQPVTRHRYYNFESLYPGVGGFIAFGDPAEAFSVRFSSPTQGLLAPKVGRPYDNLPISSMRKLGRSDGLVGLVKILGDRDVEVVKEAVLYEDEERDALVIRLVRPTLTDNVLQEYAGPCSARPESRSCQKDGVETVNGVGPDCDGNLEIDFRNLIAGPYDSCGADTAGVTLDQDIGINDVCAAQSPGAFPGTDLCAPLTSSSESSLSSQSLSSEAVDEPVDDSDSSLSSEVLACSNIPFTDTFDAGLHDSWSLKIGDYAFTEVDSPGEPVAADDICVDTVRNVYYDPVTGYVYGPVNFVHGSISSSSRGSIGSYSSLQSLYSDSLSSYSCDNGEDVGLVLRESSRRQVLVWEDCAIENSIGLRVVTHMQLTNQAARINGGLVLNYRLADPLTNPHFEYFLFQLNRNNNRVELLRFNGATFVTENSVAPPNTFGLGDWFQLEATTIDVGGGNVAITAKVSNATNPAWGTVQFTVATSRYGNGVAGYHGIGNNRAVTRFSYWMVENG